ncbi:MAG TPA: mannose-1-phosphate guanylyltransferase/mannose-6-phosphate isomerase [Steroidobacteraceae bacterium]|nr:mannose-1-phosphate guanylyltransferase/mannose-6-phosphate isomerase [Steroidobacteraceae bacterium]
MLIPVVLSGGSGTRLWPLSRELYPKQLLPLVGQGTMLQETLSRLDGVENVSTPIVVCNEQHRFLVAEQLRQIKVNSRAIVLEPIGRNTAPAVAIAALSALATTGANEDPVLLVLPADHVILNLKAFQNAVQTGLKAAQAGKLVTFGIVPDKPETGYGYIKRGDGKGPEYPVAQFVEKPNAAKAAEYIATGQYYWNSGMFMFRARTLQDELRAYAPDILDACIKAFTQAKHDLDFTRLSAEEFAACPSNSIDYAVMEKTKHAVVVPLDAGWNDVGSWSALHEAIPGDINKNVCIGDVIVDDSHGNYIHSTSRLIATVGLNDHVVVETKDAVLVARKDRVQDVKNIVNALKKQGRDETLMHREVFRPWGSYDRIDSGERFQVKRLSVNPGQSMSLQMHHHRAEHWVVVSGTARITCDGKTFLLEENQSTYIPVGAKHRIENPGKIPLHIIEVQSGSYLGEDDIVRFEDVYGRDGEKPGKV